MSVKIPIGIVKGGQGDVGPEGPTGPRGLQGLFCGTTIK